jgi:hypothetical protein
MRGRALTRPVPAAGIAGQGQVVATPSYIFASTRSRRDVPRHNGRALLILAIALLLFWTGIGVSAAILLGAL